MKLYTVDGQNIYCQEIINGNVENNLIAIGISNENAKVIAATLQTMQNFLHSKNDKNAS